MNGAKFNFIVKNTWGILLEYCIRRHFSVSKNETATERTPFSFCGTNTSGIAKCPNSDDFQRCF